MASGWKPCAMHRHERTDATIVMLTKVWAPSRCGRISRNEWQRPRVAACWCIRVTGTANRSVSPRNAALTSCIMKRKWSSGTPRQLEIQRPILFGHSDGGSIALIHAGPGLSKLRSCSGGAARFRRRVRSAKHVAIRKLYDQLICRKNFRVTRACGRNVLRME